MGGWLEILIELLEQDFYWRNNVVCVNRAKAKTPVESLGISC